MWKRFVKRFITFSIAWEKSSTGSRAQATFQPNDTDPGNQLRNGANLWNKTRGRF